MSRLARGMSALIARQKAGAVPGGAITYVRLAGGTVTLTGKAWVGRTVFARIPKEGGAAVVFGDRDYLIPAADLALSGTRFEPARGDRITEIIDGTPQVFEVLSPTGEPEWRWSDQTRTLMRVHTKQVTA